MGRCGVRGRGLVRRRELLKRRLAILVHAKPGNNESVEITLETGEKAANMSVECPSGVGRLHQVDSLVRGRAGDLAVNPAIAHSVQQASRRRV